MAFRMVPTILLLTLMGGVSDAQQAMFPELKAQNLDHKILSLPGDFSGELNLVFVAFEQDHQREVDSWLEAAPYIFKGYPGIPFYEVAAIGKDYKLARYFINKGMRYGISKEEQREHTVAVYIDKRPFEQALQIPDEKRSAVLLVDRKGKVLWRDYGLYYDIKGNSLRSALAALREASH